MTEYRLFRRNLSLLAVSWSLVGTANMLNVAASALVGHMLAENKAYATFPIALQWIAVAACTVPASFLMSKIGRRNGFVVASLIAVAGAALTIYGIYERSFLIYCVGSVFLGAGQGFNWYYRFAAAEAAPPEWKSRAISLVLAGGVVSALLAPSLADFSKDLLAPLVFAGAYATIIALQLAVIVLLQFVRIPVPPRMKFGGGRPMLEIARQPKFIVAATSGVVAYAGMVMLMSVTPLAMQMCGLSFYQTTSVIQWHVLGMFVPAFFTGSLIRRFGTYRIMLGGGVAMACCILIGTSGQTYIHFWAAQTLLGIGWNFLYVGATTLLTETYTIEERAKTQALNEFLVFIVTGSSIFVSGQLLHSLGETGNPGAGWTAVNLGALPLVLLTVVATLWLWLKSRKPAAVKRPAEAGAE